MSCFDSTSSSGFFFAHPERLAFGGSGLDFVKSFRDGVITPGFSLCAATSNTLKEDPLALSKPIPRCPGTADGTVKFEDDTDDFDEFRFFNFRGVGGGGFSIGDVVFESSTGLVVDSASSS